MQWESRSDQQARKIVEDNARELFEAAERVARMLKAGAVSVDYVNEAAFTIRIRRPSGVADVLLAIGVGLLGIAGGVLAIIVTAPPNAPLHLQSWVDPTFIAVACAGFLLAGIGGALKVKAA
jgi:hypothetical protein